MPRSNPKSHPCPKCGRAALARLCRKCRSTTTCSQADCEDPALYNGLCDMHYARKRRGLPMWPEKGMLKTYALKGGSAYE